MPDAARPQLFFFLALRFFSAFGDQFVGQSSATRYEMPKHAVKFLDLSAQVQHTHFTGFIYNQDQAVAAA
ncbi:MAG TPA: hypothetical protein VJN43_04690 [Bryobacteraceae bacterium]|nr:hypothetical protein [Bryobacteraceae bacterium]